MNWQAQILRMTIFPLKQDIAESKSWFQESLGVEPEESISNRSGLLQKIKFSFGTVSCNSEVDRVHWQLEPDPDKLILDEPSLIGGYEDTRKDFVEMAYKLLKNSACPEFYRLGFGCTLLLRVQDKILGYEELSKYLSDLRIDPQGSSDILYQINKFRTSKIISDLTINRLMKWSVIEIKRMSLQVPRQSDKSLGQYIQLELDINSANTYPKEISKDKSIDLFNELVDYASEIAVVGDVP